MTNGMSRNLSILRGIAADTHKMQTDNPELGALAAKVSELALATERVLREIHQEAESAQIAANRVRRYGM